MINWKNIKEKNETSETKVNFLLFILLNQRNKKRFKPN